MTKTRVVFLTSASNEYGGENALLELVKGLTSEFEPVVIAPAPGRLLESLGRLNVKTHVVPFAVLERRFFHPLRIFSYLFAAIASFFRLVHLFRRLKPDIVHTNNVLVLPGAFAARILGVPHVWHVREIIEKHHLSPFLWRIWRWIILTFSSSVICISSAVRRQFGHEKKAIIVHDGIDTRLFQPQKKNRNKKLSMIGIVGRLEHRRKGQDTFIEAARIALGSNNDLHFVIVGNEREEIADREQALHDLVRRYGLAEQIKFRGLVPREQMPEVMQELDILVLCSKQPEGLGIVLLEAMACEKAVISFAEGGPLDIIIDRSNGLLVPPGDVGKLADAMLELAGNTRLRKSLGRAGRKTVESCFGSEMTARKIESLYGQVLQDEKGPLQ